jgi:hypothetical protein
MTAHSATSTAGPQRHAAPGRRATRERRRRHQTAAAAWLSLKPEKITQSAKKMNLRTIRAQVKSDLEGKAKASYAGLDRQGKNQAFQETA